jgi:AbrB family looped-hinge helix DNA binding protein
LPLARECSLHALLEGLGRIDRERHCNHPILPSAATPAKGVFLPNRDRRFEDTTMTATATLSSKFQISIPKAVREEQRWQAGQEFVFIPKGKGVLVMPVPELQQLAGIAKGARKVGYRDRKDRY